MRKIAVNMVVRIPENAVSNHQVIGISEDGFCISCTRLEEETAETEWLSGIIILAPLNVSRENGENFQRMVKRLCLMSANIELIKGCKAYLVSPFDIAKMSFVDDSCIFLLK